MQWTFHSDSNIEKISINYFTGRFAIFYKLIFLQLFRFNFTWNIYLAQTCHYFFVYFVKYFTYSKNLCFYGVFLLVLMKSDLILFSDWTFQKPSIRVAFETCSQNMSWFLGKNNIFYQEFESKFSLPNFCFY